MAKLSKDNIVSDLEARGVVHDIMQGTAEQLAEGCTKVYGGVDATAASLHVGHLATFMVLKHLQKAGHIPYIILGGATSLVGDPSFRTQGRDALGTEALRHNQACIEAQVKRLFGMEEGGGNAVVLNNYDWLHAIPFLTFLREVGPYITVSYMVGKEAVKKRMETGMTYTEFAYSMLQGYDFYHLYTTHGVRMQVGGADQWANITTGAELIRKKAGGTAFGLTTPLMTRADGTKFGKTAEGKNVWLDPAMTSPYEFYQFWLNRSDEEARTCIYRMTLHEVTTLQAWEAEHAQAPHKRLLQNKLGAYLTTLVHGEEAYEQACAVTAMLFGDQPIAGQGGRVKASALQEALRGIPQVHVSKGAWEATPNIVSLLTTTTEGAIFTSKRAAREMMQAGAVRLNKVKVKDPLQPLASIPAWMEGRYVLVQKGKKNYYLICCEAT